MPRFFLEKSRAPLLLTGIGALLLLFIVVSSIWLAQTTTQLTAQVLQGRALRIAAGGALQILLDAETGQRGFLLTGNPTYLGPYDEARIRVARDMDQLEMLSRQAGPVAFEMPKLRRLVNAKLDELQQTVALARSGRRDAAIAIVDSNRGKQLMDDTRAVLGDIVSQSESSVSGNMTVLNRNALLLRTTTALGGLVIALFAGFALLLLLRAIREAVRARAEVEKLNVTLEERVMNRTAALTRANDEIQRFAYIVSHDLRAPLVNIMGFTSELEVSSEDLKTYFEDEKPETKAAALTAAKENVPEAVRFIRSSTAKMDRLITAILKLSREGRRELMAEPVNLLKVFETLLASLKHQIDETETEVKLSPQLPSIRSDRLALEQVFGNLLDNALKYLQPGRPGRLAVEVENNRSFITIRLIDNGRGIAEQDQERIFELFRRAGRQNTQGEGIGLAHVRALVRRLGGDVTVQSRLGEGSEFRVVLPRSLPQEQSSQP
jgi:signal transduction histidine kinase